MKALFVSGETVDNQDFLVPYYRLREEGVEVDIAYMERGRIRRKGYSRHIGARNRLVRTWEYDVLFVSLGAEKDLIAL